MPVVRTAEKALAADETLDKEYLPVLGLESFTTTATKLLLGADSPAIKENRVRND
jgi:aspartate aminotransferase